MLVERLGLRELDPQLCSISPESTDDVEQSLANRRVERLIRLGVQIVSVDGLIELIAKLSPSKMTTFTFISPLFR